MTYREGVNEYASGLSKPPPGAVIWDVYERKRSWNRKRVVAQLAREAYERANLVSSDGVGLSFVEVECEQVGDGS